MPVLRALTFFIPIDSYTDPGWRDISEYIDWSSHIIKEFPLKPWTVRYVLPEIDLGTKYRVIYSFLKEFFSIVGEEYPVSGLAVREGSSLIKDILKLLDRYPRLYSNILVDAGDVKGIIDFIYLSRGYSPDIYTRLSLTMMEWVKSPYFPSTVNRGNDYGFTLSFRYCDLMDRYLDGDRRPLHRFFRGVEEALAEYGSLFLGIDYSLSPWMDESVGGIIERHFNIKVGEPGTFSGIHFINNVIKRIYRRFTMPYIGFNEVMLPIGEDNILKERVREGVLRLSTLIGLSSVCVAGLDMAPLRRGKGLLYRVIKDVYTMSIVKGRPLGLRIIPVDNGVEEVDLDRFGVVPVIS